MWETAYCVDCGDEFERADDERWKKRCYDCWSAGNGASTTYRPARRHSGNSSLVAALEAENQRLKGKIFLLEEELWQAIHHRQEQKESIPAGFRDRVRELIFFTHPDRNGGSAKAGELTQWLLSIRDRY